MNVTQFRVPKGLSSHQPVERLDEVVPDCAAQAAVGQLHHGVLGPLQRLTLHHQLAVDVDLAKLGARPQVQVWRCESIELVNQYIIESLN